MDPKVERPTSSSSDSRTPYQVYLSFRGSDIHLEFIDALYDAFNDAGISVFKDDEKMRVDDVISHEILICINQFSVFVPIFSKNFAFSQWCLTELAMMFKSMKAPDGKKKKIMPIFYDVSADDVMLKTDLYAGALTKCMEMGKFSVDTVRQWEEVFLEAGKIKGYEPKDKSYAEFAKSFVRKVSLNVRVKHTLVTDYLVQRDDQVEALIKLLDIDSPGVRFVGIHGIGGIGKTTLARVVFNKLSYRYEHRCFLADVQESSSHHEGIEKLQQQLLDSAGLKLGKVRGKENGIKRIRKIQPKKKLLLVLDDISNDLQMNYLAGDASWFVSGSRIIITSRDQSVFRGEFQTLEAERMKPDEALRLFSMHAFDQDYPPNDHLSLSKEAVESCGQLPLALVVMGSLLWQKREQDYWVEIINTLNKASHKDVRDKLMISYGALEDGAKQIFLDIACFFNGRDKKYPMYMWEACEFDSEVGLQELVHMSLVKIVVRKDFETGEEHEKLWMHDELRDMGKNIASRSRIWRENEALEVVQAHECKRPDAIQALYVKKFVRGPIYLNPKAFEKMSKLRKLILRGCNFSCGPFSLPNELRWLVWENYPSPSLPPDFDPTNLIVLLLSKSRVTKLWNGQQISPKLIVMDLSGSESLTEIPDVSGMLNLNKLIADGCKSLVTVHESVGSLEKLEVLSFSECSKLRKFPPELRLPSLRHLWLDGCSKLEKFPDVLGKMEHIKTVNICETSVKELPLSFEFSTRLQFFMLNTTKLKALPKYIYHLPNLRELDLSGCKSLHGFMQKEEELEEDEDDSTSVATVSFRISNSFFPNLVELHLKFNNITSLSPCISKCYNLKKLDMSFSDRLKEIPKLPPNLEFLDNAYCKSLETVGIESLRAMGKIRMDFDNCKKLRGKKELGSVMLSRWLEGHEERMISFPKLLEDYAEDYPFQALIPGEDIPDRFYHGRTSSSVGKKNCLSFRVHSKSRVLKELSGFALFAAFSGVPYTSCMCKWLMNINGERVQAREEEPYIVPDRHVWIVYIHLKKHWKEEMMLLDRWNHFSFEAEFFPDADFSLSLWESKISLTSSGVAFIGRSGDDLYPSTEIESLGPEAMVIEEAKSKDEDAYEDAAKKMGDVSNLKSLEAPQIDSCMKPKEVKGLEIIKNLKRLESYGFRLRISSPTMTDVDDAEDKDVAMATEETEDNAKNRIAEYKTRGSLTEEMKMEMDPEASDVFLSFRELNIRQTFADVLYNCLRKEGIRVFRDDGEHFYKALPAIINSQICIPIFSKTFAASTWCLREVTEMVELEKEIIPIYYDVTPDDVALNTPVYREFMSKHKVTFGKTKVDIWQNALRAISKIKGLVILDISYIGFCSALARDVLTKLKPKRKILAMPDHLVGMDNQAEAVIKLLDIEAPDVLFVGICGIGGIGKTALAKAIFNQLSSHFDGCSFMLDIRESWWRDGVKRLQKQMLADLQGKVLEDVWIPAIESNTWNKKVLLVLDDVDQSEQIKKLAGSPSWFGMGSRIIVTTRDAGVLSAIDNAQIFEMGPRYYNQALEPLCQHETRRNFPPSKFSNPSGEAVHRTAEITSETLALHADVVLSFYTGNKEIGYLLNEDMKLAGIRVLGVDEKLFKVEETDINFFRAVDNSKICIPIITKEYISSEWCLSELAHIVDSPRKVQQLVIPIYYDVDPSDLKLEKILYADALKDPMQMFPSETVGQWKEALREITGLPGYKFKAESFEKHRKFIVSMILNKLKGRRVNILVGMQDQAEKLKQALDIESQGAVFVGIHGIEGIGKTTLAKVVFDQLRIQFERCSFLSDIRETSKHKGLKYLQDELLRDIEGADSDCNSSTKRHDFLKKVLIVLDDVDDREHIKKLVGMSKRFVSGSRIIVTTRDISVLAVEHETLDGSILEWPEEIQKFKIEGMNSGEAFQLFCSHALGEVHPQDGYYTSLCERFVSAIGGHPLALEIIGSFLNRKPEHVWAETLEKLKSDQDLHRILMISYEALEVEAKEVFLDIACFFTGSPKYAQMYMWDACELLPDQRIEDLIFLSFIKVLDDGRLWMHDEVRDFGRKIAREGTITDPAEGSRFWVNMDVLNILRSRKENTDVWGLRLCYNDFLENRTLPPGELGNLPNLRFLELSGFPSAVKRAMPELRWLSLHCSLEDVKATDLYREKLVILDLSNSDINDKWFESGKLGDSKNLKILNLTGCEEITKTPVFSKGMILERLILEDCVKLVEIDRSIGKLKQLMYLNLKGCNSLKELPDEVGSAKALTELVLQGNGQSFRLQNALVGLTSLSVLEIANVKIVGPLKIGNWERLEHLSLRECAGIKKLPAPFQPFTSLVKLDLSGSKIAQLPNSIGEMTKLKVINIGSSLTSELPKSIGKLENLEELHANKCHLLHGEIPSEIGNLSSLCILNLSFTGISSLPSTLSHLINLQTLNLECCHKLKKLPELPASLVALHITSKELQNLPDLSDLNNLIDLKLSCATYKFESEWIEKFSRLEELNLGILVVGLDFGVASKLRSLFASRRDGGILPQLPSNLTRLLLVNLTENMELQSLSNLERLISLELDCCSFNVDGFESLGLVNLQRLESFSARKCSFRSVPGPPLPLALRVLCIKDCEFIVGLLDLSTLVNLNHLELMDCRGLTEIRGLEELVSLEEILISNCGSLKSLGNLSALQKLEVLQIQSCNVLREVDGLREIKSLKHLKVCGCGSLESSARRSKSERRRYRCDTYNLVITILAMVLYITLYMKGLKWANQIAASIPTGNWNHNNF